MLAFIMTLSFIRSMPLTIGIEFMGKMDLYNISVCCQRVKVCQD